MKLHSYLELNKSEVLFGMDTTDKEGCFHFLLPDFYGTKKGFLEVNKTKKKRTLINKIFRKVEKFILEHVFMIRHCEVLPKPSFSYYEKNTPLTSLNSTPNKEKKNKELELKTMVVEAKSIRKKGYPDFDKPDFTITGEQMLELYNDYTPGHGIIISDYLRIYGCQTNAELPIRKILDMVLAAFNLTLEKYEVYLDNGNEVVSAIGADIMMANSILKLESMSVYLMPSERRDFRYCRRAYVLLKIKNAAFSPTLIDTRKTEVKGFSYVSDFYHPKYPNGALPTIDDVRRTLYWNPDVTTDSTGKATIQFYNNSTCKHLDISAEGITKSGKPFVYKDIKP